MSDKTKKILVIYKSKYGSTKRYAEWIAEDLNADLIEASRVRSKDLKNYNTIIFGGSLHAVGISGIKVIKENLKNLEGKKIIVFAVGCSPEKEYVKNNVLKSNFNENIREKINFFYLRGAFNYSNLDFVDKTMMNALRMKLKRMKPEEMDEDAKGLLECYDNPVDWTDKETIKPIVECVKKGV